VIGKSSSAGVGPFSCMGSLLQRRDSFKLPVVPECNTVLKTVNEKRLFNFHGIFHGFLIDGRIKGGRVFKANKMDGTNDRKE